MKPFALLGLIMTVLFITVSVLLRMVYPVDILPPQDLLGRALIIVGGLLTLGGLVCAGVFSRR